MSKAGVHSIALRAGVAAIAALFAADPAFEVASVKPNLTLNQAGIIRLPPGGVNAVNAPPLLLIRYAFELPDSRIVDVPDWARRTGFDVVAKAPANAVDADMRPMVRTLLRDRFKLMARRETRPMQIYTLTTEGGQLRGRRITVSKQTCAAAVARSGALNTDSRCGLVTGFGHVTGRDVSIAELAAGLTRLTASVVFDRTLVSERFDFALDYTPDAVSLDPNTARDFPNIDPNGPSLATALREQLGLRWSQVTEPIEVLKIIQIQRPEPD